MKSLIHLLMLAGPQRPLMSAAIALRVAEGLVAALPLGIVLLTTTLLLDPASVKFWPLPPADRRHGHLGGGADALECLRRTGRIVPCGIPMRPSRRLSHDGPAAPRPCRPSAPIAGGILPGARQRRHHRRGDERRHPPGNVSRRDPASADSRHRLSDHRHRGRPFRGLAPGAAVGRRNRPGALCSGRRNLPSGRGRPADDESRHRVEQPHAGIHPGHAGVEIVRVDRRPAAGMHRGRRSGPGHRQGAHRTLCAGGDPGALDGGGLRRPHGDHGLLVPAGRRDLPAVVHGVRFPGPACLRSGDRAGGVLLDHPADGLGRRAPGGGVGGSRPDGRGGSRTSPRPRHPFRRRRRRLFRRDRGVCATFPST